MFKSTSRLARRAFSSNTTPAALPKITLYQYEICPYSYKVKTVLNFLKVPYTTVEVNPVSKKQIAFSKDYRKVPIAIIETEGASPVQVNDSSVIIEHLLNNLPAGHLSPASKKQLIAPETDGPEVLSPAPAVADKLKWVDTKLAVLLFPNICRNVSEALQAFSYMRDVPSFSFLQRTMLHYAGGLAMAARNGKVKAKYNITDERRQLLDTLSEFSCELAKKGTKFHGGNQPDLADVCAFGVIRAIQHTSAHKEIIANKTANIEPWYRAMEEAVGPDHQFRIRRD